MRRSTAAIGTAVFFPAGPGMVAVFIPWLITGWHVHDPAPYWPLTQALGGLLIAAGLIPVAHAFIEFARADGTPVPVAPTRHLVVAGFNRYIRNPMYLGLLAVIAGQALLLGQFSLLLYAAGLWVVTASFVRWYEEPALARQFGAEYEAYRRVVPAWWPRLHPGKAGQPAAPERKEMTAHPGPRLGRREDP